MADARKTDRRTVYTKKAIGDAFLRVKRLKDYNTITIADGKFTVVNAVEKISIDSTATASAVLAKLTLTGATVTGIGYTADIAAGNSGNMEIALNVGQASTVYVAYTVGTNTEPCVIGIDVVRAEPVAP